MSSSYMIAAIHTIEEISWTVGMGAWNCWLLWSEGKSVMNAKVSA